MTANLNKKKGSKGRNFVTLKHCTKAYLYFSLYRGGGKVYIIYMNKTVWFVCNRKSCRS